MKITTFDQDLIGYKEFAGNLERFIPVERQFVEGSLVIALSSAFGAGKTTFLTMWQDKLAALDAKERPLVVSLNAWESDYYGDPLFAIISGLVEKLGRDDESSKKIRSAARKFKDFSMAIGNQIVDRCLSINPLEAEEYANNRAKEADDKLLPTDAFSVFEARKSAMAELKVVLNEFVTKLKEPSYLLFMVDELDRCRPDYAISYLETIKHIFDIEKAVFILAADRRQLENSAKQAFGANLDFDEYYRKFIHREVTLPKIDERGYGKICQVYAKHYLEKLGVRGSLISQNHFDDRILILIDQYKFTLRQTQEIFRIVGHACSQSENGDRSLNQMLALITIVMTIFRVKDIGLYHSLGTSSLIPENAIKFLKPDTPAWSYRHFWFKLFLIGGGIQVDINTSKAEVLRKSGLANSNDLDKCETELKTFGKEMGFLRTGITLPEVYLRIENTEQWIK